jgi:hypothetical protein
VPSVPGCEHLEGSPCRVPRLEARKLDSYSVTTGHHGHRFVRFDTKHRESSLDQRPCHLAGSTSDVEDVARLRRGQMVHEHGGVRGTQPVVLLRDQSE